MDNTNNIYKKIENDIKLVMVFTFFMPWVVTDVGGVIEKFHFIGMLSGGRGVSYTDEQIYNFVINHANGLVFNSFSFIFFLIAVLFHFSAIHDKSSFFVRIVIDIAIQCIVIFSSLLALLLSYPQYYNIINKPDHMQAQLGWGFWIYIFLFILSYIYGILFKSKIQVEDNETDKYLKETIKEVEDKETYKYLNETIKQEIKERSKNKVSARGKAYDYMEGPATFDNINYDDRMYICLLLKEGDIDEAVEFYSKAGKVSKEEARNKIEDYKKMLFE